MRLHLQVQICFRKMSSGYKATLVCIEDTSLLQTAHYEDSPDGPNYSAYACWKGNSVRYWRTPDTQGLFFVLATLLFGINHCVQDHLQWGGDTEDWKQISLIANQTFLTTAEYSTTKWMQYVLLATSQWHIYISLGAYIRVHMLHLASGSIAAWAVMSVNTALFSLSA